MKKHNFSTHIKTLGLCALISFTACKEESQQQNDDVAMSDNILLQEWTGPYQGVPAFDKMKVEDIKEAMEIGMELGLKDIEAIANNPEPPTFENTIVAMERSAEELDRVSRYYGIFSSNVSSPEFRAIQAELAPKLSDYQSKISQNEKLFQRIKAVYDASQKTPLGDQEQRVVDLTYKQFEMNGANLMLLKKHVTLKSTKNYRHCTPNSLIMFYMTKKTM